jgi:two-component system sensor histidine kinase CreC
VLAIAKPQATISQFIDRAERKILVAGVWLLALSLAVGAAVTLWLVMSVRRLRRYAQAAGEGERRNVPALPGELGDLALAMGAMRDRLASRHEVEQAMRAMTHELKSPLAAIGAAAELLHDELPRAQRERFASQIDEQAQRLRSMVDRLLELSKLEALQVPEHPRETTLLELVQAELQSVAAVLAQRNLRVHWLEESPVQVRGDAQRISMAISNLLANALAFAPEGSQLELAVRRTGDEAEFSIRDHGPGVPDYAMPQLGRRFFSLPRPGDGRKGSGMGLAIVRQVALLHGGRLVFEPASPGLCVRFSLKSA